MASSTIQHSDAHDAYDAVASVLTGDLAGYRERVLPPGVSTDRMTPARLLEAVQLERHLARFAADYPGADPRAVASLWSCWYCAIVLPPLIAACTALARPPMVGLDDLELVLAANGLVSAVHFLRLRPMSDEPGSASFRAIIHQHLRPFVAAMVRHAALSERLVWSNAAAYIHWTADIIDDGRQFLSTAIWPDGERNPLYGHITEKEEDGSRIARRRTCCLRYLLPAHAGCGAACPRPADERDMRGAASSNGG